LTFNVRVFGAAGAIIGHRGPTVPGILFTVRGWLWKKKSTAHIYPTGATDILDIIRKQNNDLLSNNSDFMINNLLATSDNSTGSRYANNLNNTLPSSCSLEPKGFEWMDLVQTYQKNRNSLHHSVFSSQFYQ
jgi:hypothetical protein